MNQTQDEAFQRYASSQILFFVAFRFFLEWLKVEWALFTFSQDPFLTPGSTNVDFDSAIVERYVQSEA